MATFLEQAKRLRDDQGRALRAVPDRPTDPFQAPSRPAGDGSADEAYVRTALENEIELVRTAPAGTRNHALNKAAFCLGGLVATGQLTEAAVTAALTGAALAAGLEEREISRTLASGLSKGALNPRAVPATQVLRGVYATREQADERWSEPEPLEGRGEAPGPFPLHTLPGVAGQFTAHVAAGTQTPPDMAGMMVLAVLSAAAANRAWVQGAPGWTEPLTLWCLTVLPPASRKSAVAGLVARPLYLLERRLTEEHAEASRGKEARLAVALKRKDKLIADAAKAIARHERDALAVELNEIDDEISDLRPGAPPRLLLDDFTPEALGVALQAGNGHVGVISAEGGVFAAITGRYQQGTPQLDLILKSYDGDPYRADRVGRDPVTVDRPAVVLGLAVQPHVLADTTRHPALRERGLMGRFAYAVPVDTVGTRDLDAPAIPGHLPGAWAALVEQITRIPVCGHGSALRVMTLDSDAAELHRGFRAHIEPRLHGETGDLAFMADWAGKLAGRVLRVAGLLHLAARADPADPVSFDTMHAAVQIGEWMLAHAVQVYGGWRATGEHEDAERVLRWLRRAQPREFTVRDVYEALRGQTWCNRADDVREALVVLAEHGWVTSVERQMSDGQRRMKDGLFLPHPCLLEGS